jgi:class 3 adenylate cyclase
MDIEALDGAIAKLTESTPDLRPAARGFRDWLVASDEVQRLRINPYDVAKVYDVPVQNLITFALQGVAAGLFDLHWLVHCPHCNMITKECGNFFELTNSSDCKMCETGFDVDVLTRIEVTFSLNRSIEDVDASAFCLPPPVLRPKVNIAVGPGGTVSGNDTIDNPGRYRFFCPITLAKGILEVSGEPTDRIQEFSVRQLPSLNYDQTSLVARPGPVSFDLVNHCDKVSGIFIIPDELPEELILEALPPRLTGLEVIHYPDYRALFGDQALAGSEHLQVSSVTLMFTDIAGSTVMYEKMGNAGAYAAVRRHFDLLFQYVETHGGFVIKTIGDAVMASFRTNDDALSCALAAQRDFGAHFEGQGDDGGIRVKFGIHRGPAILVNLNGRIDYFGSTVNKAARIQDTAAPNELVLSSEAHTDCTLAEAVLKTGGANLREEHITLKGIDAGQTVFRIANPGAQGLPGG